MKRALIRCAGAAATALLTLTVASAQPEPAAPKPSDAPPPQNAAPAPAPRGPADIIGGAGRARAARELQQAGERGATAAPSAAPAPAQAPAAPPPAADPHAAGARRPAGHAGAGPEERQIATERPDDSLPNGTIRVTVFDHEGVPAPAAEVVLGVMGADSTRTQRSARTGQDGVALFTGLASGEKQAYRVNVPYQGAKYSSMPFRLSPRGGYQVEVQRLPVTRDPRMLVLYVGAASLELKDDRIHVVQQSRLWNVGQQTYVFGDEGDLVRLPPGFMAVQVQESMTDQHVKESKEGLRITGSVPPGEVTLLWGFDLPLHGTEASFAIDIPWPTFAYRVISDAPAGMSLEVKDMPQPLEHGDSGRKYLVTEMQRKIGDEPFRRLDVTLRGIPGPGPGRWIAALIALFTVGIGIALAQRAPTAVAATREDFDERRTELLDRARDLEARHKAGDIGPQFHEEQLRAIGEELAALLYEEQQQTSAANLKPKPA